METMTATQMATVYGLKSPQAFNKLMEKCGVLTHNAKGYFLSDELKGMGYVDVIDYPFFLPSGIRCTKKKSVWTEKGQQFIRQRLGRIGIVPTNEQLNMFTTTN